MLSQHRAHRVAVVAVVVVHILVARIEVQVVRVVAAIRRRRPVVAVVALVVDIAVVAVASSRKEHAAEIRCRSSADTLTRRRHRVRSSCHAVILPERPSGRFTVRRPMNLPTVSYPYLMSECISCFYIIAESFLLSSETNTMVSMGDLLSRG